MRKYWQIAVSGWQVFLSRRLNSSLELFGYLLTTFVSLTLWTFVFQKTGKSLIGGYTPAQMVAYLLLAGLITGTFWYTAQGDYLAEEIRQGLISRYIVRPINFILYHFVYVVTAKLLQFVLTVVFLILLLSIFRIPVDLHILHWQYLLLFLLLLIIAAAIQFFIFFVPSLFAFWFDEVWGITFVIRVFSDIAAGAFLPLTLFAPLWQHVFNFLPFKYIISVPVMLLMGRLTPNEIMLAFGMALFWLAFFVVLAIILVRRGLNHYSAVGG